MDRVRGARLKHRAGLGGRKIRSRPHTSFGPPNGGLVREIPQSPYFREISVGEILFQLARMMIVTILFWRREITPKRNISPKGSKKFGGLSAMFVFSMVCLIFSANV